ncbi:MAG: alpha/beta hydrolase [Granulosicoccus sp.]
MPIRIVHCLLYLSVILMLSGCLSMMGDGPVASPRAERDNYVLEEQIHISASGCHYEYRMYQPNQPRTDTSVMLGHGFLRDQDTMIGLSRAIANQGIRVVTLDFCSMRLWNGHHRSNAQDMRELARKLRIADDIIYAGFSAGALAAVLAADNDTRAIVTLDLVDQADLGLTRITQLQTPLIGLAGPATSCNDNNNGDAVYGARDNDSISDLVRIPGASHCDFEAPTNWLCRFACGNWNETDSEKARRTDIIDQTVKHLLPFLSKRPQNPQVPASAVNPLSPLL